MMTESQIQKSCCDLMESLRRRGEPVIFTRTNAGRFSGAGGVVQGCAPGWPDVTACISGQFVGIEFKTAKGRQSESQKAQQEAIQAAGGEYLLIRSVADFREWIRGEI